MIVTLVDGRLSESMIMAGFLGDPKGERTVGAIGFGPQPERAVFLVGPNKERISNIVMVPAFP